MKELKMFPQITEETEENLLHLEDEPRSPFSKTPPSNPSPSTSDSPTEAPSSPNDEHQVPPVLTVTSEDSSSPPPHSLLLQQQSHSLEEECTAPARVRMRSLSGGPYRLAPQPLPTARTRRQSGDDVLSRVSPSRRVAPLIEHFRPRSKSDSKGKRPTFLANLRSTFFSGAPRKTSLEAEPPPLDSLLQPDYRQRSRSGSETRGGTMSKMIDLFRSRSNSLSADSRQRKETTVSINALLRRHSVDPDKRRRTYNSYRSLEAHQGDSFTVHSEDETADRIDYSKLAEERIIATFLTSHECYDVIPISGKIIVLSVDLLVKNAFSALVTNEINAAPLWDSGLHDFVGFLTITDFINVLRHYFYSSPEDIKDIENQSISTWRRITKVPNRFVKINGSKSLSEAARLLVQEGVHRIPVFDEKRQVVLFVLTRKRLLQYLSSYLFDKLDQFNIKTPTFFKKTLREVGVGTYEKIATVTETAKVIDALDLFVNRGVSSLPVVDEDGVIKDIFGKMDVFALAKEQMYHNLDITVYEVIRKNVPRECAFICTLDDSFGTVIQRFISTKSHRMVVIDDIRSVVGIISLSDLLKFLVLEPLAAMALDAGAGNASDIIEEGAEGAVGGADVDAVFNDDSVNVTGESSKDESLALTSMKDLNISKDNEVEPVTEAVLKSE